MAQAYLFVHFREKTTPDGEQVYFGISRDGFHWEAVNDGVPGAGQGYVPFVADSLASGKFVRSDASFSFPYGYKHGTILATVYKGNIIKNLIMDCQSYTKYRPNETTGGIFVSWRRKEELPTGA